ncbi:MAG: hypothetical protein HOV79_15180 [Hamadaea sp.]|nr:hypothetical protein [Hamadaea sp.]
MPRFDLGLDELRAYRPDVREPADFHEFWTGTVHSYNEHEGGAASQWPAQAAFLAARVAS